jgi:hypothetical protein
MWNNLILDHIVIPTAALHTCVTWQGTNYELPEDDTIVSKHVAAA